MKPETDLAIYLNFPFDGTNPSIRLRLLNIRKPLRKLNVKADHVYRYEDLAPYQNILIGHFSKEAVEQCKNLRKQGKTLFYSHTEDLWHLDYQSETFNLCDYIICCSTALAKATQARLTSPYTKCVVIPDMAEGPRPEGRPLHQPSDKKELSVVYCGMGGNSYLAKHLKPIIEKLDMRLILITEHGDADIRWNRDTYLYDMSLADIAICPQNYKLQPCKSNVKLSTALSLGLPTVSSPLQAYTEIITNGYNGFIADEDQEWETALLKLKDYQTRCRIARAAWETGLEYWPDRIAEKYRDLLLNTKRVVYVNNTLPQKYLSYGDSVLEILRSAGGAVYEEYRYEDIDSLPECDMQIFIEVRYDPTDLVYPITTPRVLITKENQDLNNLAHFNVIITPNANLASYWTTRGFVNVYLVDLEKLSYSLIRDYVDLDITAKRQSHNLKLHDEHINAFHHLIPPEERWSGGDRDQAHILYTMSNTKPSDKVLDLGSADGWLSLYLATQHREVSALEFVDRGIDWTYQHATRLGVGVDLRIGFLEEVDKIFSDEKFDVILMYELMEHIDFWRLPWYFKKMENILRPGGSILISLPMQDLKDNSEHLWSPSDKLINKIFKNKNFSYKWTDLPNHGVPGVWFIRYNT